jgi:hypothetical protein
LSADAAPGPAPAGGHVRFTIVLAAPVVLAGLLVFTHWRAYDYGRVSEREAAQRALAEQREREVRLLEELETERKKLRVEYRERIKVVQKAADPLVCIDQKVPVTLLKSLHREKP